MLQMDVLQSSVVAALPFPHMTVANVLRPESEAALARDFPDMKMAGFFPVDDLTYGESFAELIEDLRCDAFSEIMADKFKLPLDRAPTLITIRRLSARKDGRIHTDGADKVASALIYLNPGWDSREGRLRMLSQPSFDAANAIEIDPVYGNFIAFQRSETSYHGHLPFVGERRVVQIAWLTGVEALNRKQKRHGRISFLKSLLHGFGASRGRGPAPPAPPQPVDRSGAADAAPKPNPARARAARTG
jgi:SM-20-related protein